MAARVSWRRVIPRRNTLKLTGGPPKIKIKKNSCTTVAAPLFGSDDVGRQKVQQEANDNEDDNVRSSDQLETEQLKALYGDSKMVVAQTKLKLALFYHRQGAYEQADNMYVDALRISKLVNGPDHPDNANIQNNLGALYADQTEYVQAESMYVDALRIFKVVHGPDHLLLRSDTK